MKNQRRIYVCGLLIGVLWAWVTTSFAIHASKTHVLQNSQQLVVILLHQSGKPASLRRFQRASNTQPWQIVGKRSHLYNSPTVPLGIFSWGPAFGVMPVGSKGMKLPYIPITKTSICVLDPQSKFYNKVLDQKQILLPDWHNALSLQGMDRNETGVMIKRNLWGNTPDKAPVCFFMVMQREHIAKRFGYLALPKTELLNLLSWLDPNKTPILAVFPKRTYRKIYEVNHLPKL